MVNKDNVKQHEIIYIHIKKETLWTITKLILTIPTAVYFYLSYIWSIKPEAWYNPTLSEWWIIGCVFNLMIYFVLLVIAVIGINGGLKDK